MIRVWAGKQGSADADDAYWTRVEEDCRRVAAMAEEHGILLVSEFHGGTLTDTNESAVQFLQRVDHPGFGTYWQPPGNRPFDYRLEGLHRVTPWLRGIHCFQWTDNPRERRPLAEGAEHWRAYLKAARGAGAMYVLMEFVAEDDPANFLRDAATLKAWLADVNG
jgi:sugar phosphate isomerase/epimerase